MTERLLYPLKFTPILKDKIWGGSLLREQFGKVSASSNCGESWELSGVENEESVVSNGFLAGNSLTELIEIYMGELIGDSHFKKYGLSFPLLFKLIDANDNLSIQVHPDDVLAAERHNCFGKTEMWYVVEALPGSSLIIGFSKDCTKDEYLKALKDGTIENLLQKVPVQKGDVFFIPAGLVHAIGAGVLIAEIQQSSDITYRIYDYNRKDDKGKERELHTQQALEAVNYQGTKEPKTKYTAATNQVEELVNCEYFTTNILKFDELIERNYQQLDSFVTYMCLEGNFEIECNGEKVQIVKGETALIPACIDNVKLIPNELTTILEVYI